MPAPYPQEFSDDAGLEQTIPEHAQGEVLECGALVSSDDAVADTGRPPERFGQFTLVGVGAPSEAVPAWSTNRGIASMSHGDAAGWK
ncbi:hypothetical protein [Mariniluteicoccus flavus]